MSTDRPTPGSDAPPDTVEPDSEELSAGLSRRPAPGRTPGWLRAESLPGSLPPKRRLAITAEAGIRLRRQLPSGFPWTKPTWPTTVPKAAKRSDLGVRYETTWARRYPVRLARAAVTEVVTRPLVAAVAHPSVRGLDRVEHLDGPVILAANHLSHLDTPLVLSLLPDRWRHRTVPLAAADYFFDTKAKAILTAFLLNAVPIDRLRVSRDAANRAAGLVAEGWNLLIFPEGGRSPDGWGQEHQAGAAWLSERTGRPVVPIHLEGTGRILPRGETRLRVGDTKLTFGRAIWPEVPVRDLARHIQSAVAELADETATDWWSARQRAAAGTTPSLEGPAASSWRRAWALGPSPKDRARKRAPAERRWPRT
jgi:1-acyl-sn-glycerol-3-phosphate acyltransferase